MEKLTVYADVIVNISVSSLDKPFQYRIPDPLTETVQIGSRVKVSFGGRMTSGYVVGLSHQAELPEEKIHPIEGIYDKSVRIEDRMIALAFWMKERYGCTLNQALSAVLPTKAVVRKGTQKKNLTDLLDDVEIMSPLPLNKEQEDARKAILEEQAGANRPVLLHGVTGSGKTEVYMSIVDEMIRQGRQTILLIPEIALTYQNLRRFYQRFGARIGVVHSRQSKGEKYETFEKARKGQLDLIIGPRSALFSPFPNLGLIVVDEEHEESYFSELSPRYHSVEVAKQITKICGASLLLGSATPSMDSYYRAKSGEYRLVTLKNRAVESSRLPKVEIVDLREELQSGNKSIFSRSLKEKIADRLEQKEQIILFLNRRGYAGFVSCRSCGKALLCPHCDVSLTYHRDGSLRCHYCGYHIRMPDRCPSCGSPYVAAFGTGTQKVETILQKEFPAARILRMDADTTRGKGGHERILSVFSHQGADILLGTQMIVKGHDFSNVSLVGILAADLSLYSGDYRAAERTFNLLTQAAGRAGRSRLPGEVIIQTYLPEHYAIVKAAAQDYEGFYEEELSRRELLHYPPAGAMLSVLVSGSDIEETARLAQSLADLVPARFPDAGATVLGPAAHPRSKVQDQYRQQLFVKHPDDAVLMQIRNEMEALADADAQFDIK